MATIDNRTTFDQTIRIFDSFYAVDLVVPSSQYDIVHGFFINICDTKSIANNFTAILFRVAQETKINALDLLQQLQSSSGDKLKMNQILAYYLNSFKSKTSLYGIGSIQQPNYPVARNIVQ
jgi:hypothetical protein